MINTELRVGNLVDFKGEIKIVYQIRESGCDFHIGGKAFQSWLWKAIEPIPISEEWLLKFGFIPNPYQDRYELDNIYFQGCKLCFECDKTKGFTELWISEFPNIKYVHQLQNLFHLVTGSELQLVKNGTNFQK